MYVCVCVRVSYREGKRECVNERVKHKLRLKAIVAGVNVAGNRDRERGREQWERTMIMLNRGRETERVSERGWAMRRQNAAFAKALVSLEKTTLWRSDTSSFFGKPNNNCKENIPNNFWLISSPIKHCIYIYLCCVRFTLLQAQHSQHQQQLLHQLKSS